MVDEASHYQAWLQQSHEQWESLCGRCGACCGAFDGDPCVHLRRDAKGFYGCAIYENRFGEQRTVSGRVINCVPIRQILETSWRGDECCGYKRDRKGSQIS